MENQSLQKKLISRKKATIYALIILICSFIAGLNLGYNFARPTPLSPEIIFKKETEPLNWNFFEEVLDDIERHYVRQPVSRKDLFYSALEGLVRGLGDPYSVFLNPELTKKFQEEMTGSFEGVGIEIGIKNNRLTVIAPLSGTPAEKAGIRAGDQIYAIDGEDTTGITLDEAVSKIRGPKGTKVVLTIFRENFEKPQDFEIIRDVIVIKTVKFEMKNDFAYLKISHFIDTTLEDFKKEVPKILKAKPKGIILDLRNNPGGYLNSAVEIAGYWLGKEVVTISRDAQNNEREYRANGEGEFSNYRTVILINGGTASGAEILAGALKDHKGFTLIGEKSFGKGSIQELKTFSDGSSLKLTTAFWLTPKKHLINGEGIVPDVEVKLTEEDYNADRDPQLDKAIEILKEGK